MKPIVVVTSALALALICPGTARSQPALPVPEVPTEVVDADLEEAPPLPGLWGTLAELREKRFVDLTHAFGPEIPRWPGFPEERRTVLYDHEPGLGALGHGFLAHEYCHVGQWGTHVDPPVHFVKGKRSLDDIPVEEMLLPLVVFDVSAEVELNPDYQITLSDVLAWEHRHGPVPRGAFAVMRTDWSKRWPDPEAMRNEDAEGIAHYPGWSEEALRYLYEDRDITASGHETTDTDPGVSTSRGNYSLERYVLERDRYQIELLANLDQVPEAGAIAVVTFPKPESGSGFPARVFAILP